MFSKSVAFSIPSNPIYLPPANEVWAKVIFSEACVKNSVHGGSSTWAGTPPGPGRHTPWDQTGTPPDQAGTLPGPGTPPWDQAGTPPRPGTPPGTRQVHPPDQADTPPGTRQVHPPTRYTSRDQASTPPRPGTPRTRQVPPPPAVHAGRYGQLAGGTHPTGMHSCFIQKNISTNNSAKFFFVDCPVVRHCKWCIPAIRLFLPLSLSVSISNTHTDQ